MRRYVHFHWRTRHSAQMNGICPFGADIYLDVYWNDFMYTRIVLMFHKHKFTESTAQCINHGPFKIFSLKEKKKLENETKCQKCPKRYPSVQRSLREQKVYVHHYVFTMEYYQTMGYICDSTWKCEKFIRPNGIFQIDMYQCCASKTMAMHIANKIETERVRARVLDTKRSKRNGMENVLTSKNGWGKRL